MFDLLVGTYSRDEKKPRGVHIIRFDEETKEFSYIDRVIPECTAGYLCFDRKNNLLYVCDESDHREDGGARIYSLKYDPENGSLKELNHLDALMNKPCYISFENDRKYVAYSCHTNKSYVSRVARNEDGSFSWIREYDSAGVGLVRLNADGSFDRIVDVCCFAEETGNGKVKHSLCHSANFAQPGDIFITGDKGLDKLYSFKAKDDHIEMISKVAMPSDSFPRYSVFSKDLRTVYFNTERTNRIYAFRFDAEEGIKESLGSYELLDKDLPCEPSDMCISHDGKHLYVAVRRTLCIVVFDILEDDSLVKIQQIDSGEGSSIRGMNLSPDDRFLITAHASGNCLKLFEIADDGKLMYQGATYECDCPGNVVFIKR